VAPSVILTSVVGIAAAFGVCEYAHGRTVARIVRVQMVASALCLNSTLYFLGVA